MARTPLAAFFNSPIKALAQACPHCPIAAPIIHRTYRTLVNGNACFGKRLIFISGLNVDISPPQPQAFPLTTFVPWAALIQDENGQCSVLE